MNIRQSKVFWIEKDQDGNIGIGPTKNSCDRDFPEAVGPRLSCGECIRVRLVEVRASRKRT